MNNPQNHQKPKTYGPYSPMRKIGDWVFVSGQIGANPLNGYLDEDAAKQTIQALENMRAVLKSAGLDMQHVVETTLFVTDMADFSFINDAYGQFFAEPYPARACVAVKELPRVGGSVPVKIEIRAIAIGSST